MAEYSGIVLRRVGGFYRVLCGSEVFICKPRGRLKLDFGDILPGDYVLVSADSDKKNGCIIERVKERKNQLIRPKIANISGIIAVISAAFPSPDWLLLDKILISMEYYGLSGVICINKCDSICGEESVIFEKSALYQRLGYSVLMLSALNSIGVEELRLVPDEGIWVFAGASGVGKSSLFNALLEGEHMKVGLVSERSERGRHTTRHAEIIPIGGALLADTPGFSLLDMPPEMTMEDLRFCYPEFPLNACRFDACLHNSEPGCRVKDMLQTGEVDVDRYERYISLLQALKERAAKY